MYCLLLVGGFFLVGDELLAPVELRGDLSLPLLFLGFCDGVVFRPSLALDFVLPPALPLLVAAKKSWIIDCVSSSFFRKRILLVKPFDGSGTDIRWNEVLGVVETEEEGATKPSLVSNPSSSNRCSSRNVLGK